jgi:hypothetical protein
MGTAAIESTRELFDKTANDTGAPPENDIGAWVVQLHKAWSGNEEAAAVLVDKLLEAVDGRIDVA